MDNGDEFSDRIQNNKSLLLHHDCKINHEDTPSEKLQPKKLAKRIIILIF
jgi:hypothetical protein